jgi:peptidoglycan hydrolase-like protein with peptidoglycan-binding domain
MTKRVNGGTIGLEDRTRRWEHALGLFTGETVAAPAQAHDEGEVVYKTVKKGSRGPTVKAVQEALGITADGVFGPGTERTVRAWQLANDLVADGIVGPRTLRVMLG